MVFMSRKFHLSVTMKVLSRLPIILCNILARSILILDIISFVIMFSVKILLSAMRTEEQLTDIFTKPLDEKRLCALRCELNILDSLNVLMSVDLGFGNESPILDHINEAEQAAPKKKGGKTKETNNARGILESIRI